MTKAAFAQADTGGSLTAVRRDLSETSQELENLRVALDAKLATLEAALASAEPSDSLETLVIDLARTATAEAEAAALRACLEVQLVAQEQVEAIRVEAEQSVETERTTVAAVHAHLEDLEATLQAERETAVLLRREIEEQQGALEGEREAGGALQRNLEEAEQRISAVESAKEVEVAGVREQLMNKLALQRADLEELERVLEKLRSDLRDAQDSVDKGLADSQAAQSSLEAAEREAAQIEIERQKALAEVEAAISDRDALTAQLEAARQEALGESEAAVRDRDALTAQLEAAREDAHKQLAEFQAAQLGLEAAEHQTAQIELERQEALASVEAVVGEREALSTQLETAREDADKQVAEFRAVQLSLETAEHHTAQTEVERQEALAAAETAVRERDALSAQLEAARDDADKQLAEFQAVQASLEAVEHQKAQTELHRLEALEDAEAVRQERDALSAQLEAAREEGDKRSAELEQKFEETQIRLEAAERQTAETEKVWQESDTRAEAAVRERDALAEELDAARAAVGAGSEVLERINAADAERAEIARVLGETEAALEATMRDRDAVTAEAESACHAAKAAIIDVEARYEELRASTERRIRDLELELREAAAGDVGFASVAAGASAPVDDVNSCSGGEFQFAGTAGEPPRAPRRGSSPDRRCARNPRGPVVQRRADSVGNGLEAQPHRQADAPVRPESDSVQGKNRVGASRAANRRDTFEVPRWHLLQCRGRGCRRNLPGEARRRSQSRSDPGKNPTEARLRLEKYHSCTSVSGFSRTTHGPAP